MTHRQQKRKRHPPSKDYANFPYTATRKGQPYKYSIIYGDSFQGGAWKIYERKIFMSSFNHSLDLFLTACRETAYAELQNNEEYAEFKTKQSSLPSELETLISDEAKKVLFSYLETTSDILGIEANNIMLCGLTLMSEMQKRFDTSAPEYKAFAKEYL